MCSCHSILECCVTFSGVKLSIRSFVLFIWYLCTVLINVHIASPNPNEWNSTLTSAKRGKRC